MTNATLSGDEALQLLVEPEGLGVTIVTITPEAAATFLSANSRNRAISATRVQNLVRILRTGKWKLTPDAIAIDTEGLILNGQHRLAACLEAAIPIEVLLYVGAEADVRFVTDTGLKRSFAQALHMTGHVNVAQLGAAVSLHYRFSHQMLRLERPLGSWTPDRERTQGNQSLDHATLLQWEADHPEIDQAVTGYTSQIRHYLPQWKASSHAVLCALTQVIDNDANVEFMERVIKGEDLRAGDPEYTFRNWITRSGREANQVRTLAVGLKMWNARREGRTVQSVAFRSDERFPQPR